jgi:hypothetical protein
MEQPSFFCRRSNPICHTWHSTLNLTKRRRTTTFQPMCTRLKSTTLSEMSSASILIMYSLDTKGRGRTKTIAFLEPPTHTEPRTDKRQRAAVGWRVQETGLRNELNQAQPPSFKAFSNASTMLLLSSYQTSTLLTEGAASPAAMADTDFCMEKVSL